MRRSVAGRPRKPHKLRALEGGRGHSRPLTPDLPAPADALVVPAGFSREERAAWDLHAQRVRKLGLESSVDGGVIEAMVRHYVRARQAEREIKKHGLTVETMAGPKKRPEVMIAKESWHEYTQLCGQFGMTPAGRAKLGGDGKKPEGAGDVPPELRDASAG